MNWWQMVLSGVLVVIGHARSMSVYGTEKRTYQATLHLYGLNDRLTFTRSTTTCEDVDELVEAMDGLVNRYL